MADARGAGYSRMGSMDQEHEIQGSNHGFIVYRRRWVVLLAFCLVSIANQTIYGTFTTISTFAHEHFNVGYIAIDFASTVFLIMFVPSSAFVPLLVGKWGHAVTMYLAAVVTVIGPWVRMINTDSVVWMLVGQSVTAIGQPVLFANIPALSQAWFPESERALATGLMFVANNIIGIGVSMQIPAFLAPNAASIPNCMLVEAIVCTCLCILFVLMYRETPKTPPSASAALQASQHRPGSPSKTQRGTGSPQDSSRAWLHDNSTDGRLDLGAPMTFKLSLAHLFSNAPWLLVVVMNGMFVAVFSAMPTFGNRFMEQYGYSDTFFAAVGGAFLGSGAVGVFVATPILDKTHAFKPILAVLCTICAAGMVIASLELKPDNDIALIVLFGIVGAASVPATAAFVELGCEVAYPVPESTSSGILFMVGQVLAILFIVGANRLLDYGYPDALKWLMSGCIASTLVFLAVFKGELKRLMVDQQDKEKTDLGPRSLMNPASDTFDA